MSATEDDPAFAALPPTLKRRIDQAFDAVVSPQKRHKPGQSTPSQQGGFLVDEPPAGGFLADAGGFLPGPQAGGFLRDGSPSFSVDALEQSTHMIPLSSIPDALQILDLQPDDEDVLAVFQNAATGWRDRSRAQSPAEGSQDAFVSRKDWRAVCAALLDTGPIDTDVPMSDDDAHAEDDVQVLEDLSDLTADSAEEYVDSGGTESGDDDSDDEYQEGGFVSTKGATASQARPSKSTRGRRSHTRKSSSASCEGDADEGEHARLTARQKKECRTAFALFFPDVPDKDLNRQRIRIKDITRVAKLLKEKLSTEEVSTDKITHARHSSSLCVRRRLWRCSKHSRRPRTNPWDSPTSSV